MKLRIDQMFDEERFPSFLYCLPLLFYFPLGCSLAVVRFFIGIQAFLLSILLSKFPTIRWIMCSILGFIVFAEHYEYYDKQVKVFVSNHVTNFDHLAMNLLLPVAVPSVWNLPPFLMWILGYTNFDVSKGHQILIKNVRQFLKESTVPVLIFPEGATTNSKKGLLKFNSWPFLLNHDVQPVAVKVSRPMLMKISPSILSSRWWSDMFWFLFVPYTAFTVRFLPVTLKADFEDTEAFSKNVQEQICKELALEKTNYTSVDKVEYAKTVLQ